MQIACYLHNVLCQEYANDAYNLRVPASVSECSHKLQREDIFNFFNYIYFSVLLLKLAKMTSTIPTENKHKVRSHSLCTIKE